MDRSYTIDTDMIEATVKAYFGHNFLPEDTTEEEEASEEDEEPQLDEQ